MFSFSHHTKSEVETMGKKQGVGNGESRDAVFEFLVLYKRQHDGNTPSTREIAAACCLSTSGVNYHLTWLDIEDRIRVSRDGHRRVEIIGGSWEMTDPQDGTCEGEDVNPDSDPKAGQER